MNNVNLIGRLTSDPELKVLTENEKKYIRFTLAVDRGISKEQKEQGKVSADFIQCQIWDKSAEIINQYCKKGSQIGITGKIRTGSYDKDDGTKVYTTEILVGHVQLLDSKPKSERPEPEYPYSTGEDNSNSFEDLGAEVSLSDSDLPF